MVSEGSKIDMAFPYLAVDLRWIDASSDNRSKAVGDPIYEDVNQIWGFGKVGATSIIRDEQWNAKAALPNKTTSFVTKRLIGVQLRRVDAKDALRDIARTDQSARCPKVDKIFGQLPDVEQFQRFQTTDDGFKEFGCYIIAEATITAGSFPGKNCIVANMTSLANYATCYIQRDDNAVEEHWLTGLALDFTSEVLNNLDEYVSGMLKPGFHAAWNGLMITLRHETEPATFKAVSPIVKASIDNTKLYIWLAMHATLTISAILVLLAQHVSRTKTVRDPTIAALTIDLTEIAHSGRANGLCDAVTLSKEDSKLPSLRWVENGVRSGRRKACSEDLCVRKVIFVDEAPNTPRRLR
ncbi:MAG: hypothetical protein Q9213_006612 [Squamulea squamosa]